MLTKPKILLHLEGAVILILSVFFYNFAHTYLNPTILLAIAYFATKAQLFPIALIWATHIGFDRLLGFGLKYPTNFKDTHLQHV
jgi:hypothetical protein